MAHLEFFPEERIRLDREIKNHPDLVAILQSQPHEDFEIRLLEVATYCGIVLHGDYLQEDFTKLCDILYKKLVEKRSLVIIN